MQDERMITEPTNEELAIILEMRWRAHPHHSRLGALWESIYTLTRRALCAEAEARGETFPPLGECVITDQSPLGERRRPPTPSGGAALPLVD